jgi:hypothetical protein
MVKLAAVPPIRTYWSAYAANHSKKIQKSLTMDAVLSIRPARLVEDGFERHVGAANCKPT